MAITNMKNLREFMLEELERLRAGKSTPAATNASANIAGKVMSSVKMELEYNKMVGTVPSIPFLSKKLVLSLDGNDEKE